MATMKGRFSLAVIGFVLGAALSYRAALLAEGLAVYRGRTPGLIVFFHLLPFKTDVVSPLCGCFGFRPWLTCNPIQHDLRFSSSHVEGVQLLQFVGIGVPAVMRKAGSHGEGDIQDTHRGSELV